MEAITPTPNSERVTIYVRNDFGAVKIIEGARLVRVQQAPYAQHQNAAHVDFIPTGKRSVRRIVQGYRPFILILKGIGHPHPDSWMVPIESKTLGITESSKSRYLSHDPRYLTDFNDLIAPHLAAHPDVVIFDCREV